VLYRVAIAIFRLCEQRILDSMSAVDVQTAVKVICKNTTLIELFQVTFAIPPIKVSTVKRLGQTTASVLQKSGSIEEEQVYYRPHLSQPSSIIDEDLLSKFYGLLPAKRRILDPKRLYSSEKQGFSVRTLFSSAENLEPTFILIKTDKGILIGAFISTSWTAWTSNTKGNYSWSGDNTSFIFILSPRIKAFKASRANTNFFQPTAEGVSFGYGIDKKIGLHMDADLLSGSTNRCETYNNEPLVEGGIFKIQQVEVYGFND